MSSHIYEYGALDNIWYTLSVIYATAMQQYLFSYSLVIVLSKEYNHKKKRKIRYHPLNVVTEAWVIFSS